MCPPALGRQGGPDSHRIGKGWIVIEYAELPCQASDPELWFSQRPAELELAKAQCQPCPIRLSCLSGALARSEPHGVWGGQIFDNGAVVEFKRARGRPRKVDREDAPVSRTG
jgi:WhiB family redox-sensing transcriptional regulator